MAFLQDGTPIFGYITAFTTHDGWLLAALYNPANLTTYILRAKDRRTLGVDIANPLVWHGAEQVLATTDTLVTHLRAIPPSGAAFTNQPLYLWMFATDNFSSIQVPNLYYAPLPTGPGRSRCRPRAGRSPFNPTGRVYHTAQNWDDRNALKAVRRYDLANRKTTATSTIELKTRADGDPADDHQPGHLDEPGHGDQRCRLITPTTAITGRSIALQAILTTPAPYTAPPILHEVSARAAVRRETFKVRHLWVVLEKDHELPSGATDLRDQDTVFDSLAALQTASYQTFVNEQGDTETVLVEQGIQFARRRRRGRLADAGPDRAEQGRVGWASTSAIDRTPT
jgi:hypothetical protein